MIRILTILLFASSVMAQSADLNVVLTDLGQPRVLFTLLNQGPDAARNVRLEMDVPPPLTVQQIHGEKMTCEVTGTRLRCNFGDMARYPDYRSADIILSAPLVDATYTLTGTFTSDTPDPNPSNNVLTQAFTVRIEADLNVRIMPETARIDPGAVHIFYTEVANYLNIVSPRDVRVSFAAQNGTIERIVAEPRWTCTIDGNAAECRADSLDEGCWCSGPMEVWVRASPDRGGGETTFVARATSNLPERYTANDSAEGRLETYRHLVVSTTADAGEGSLRGAIEEANQSCTPGPCKIVFELPDGAPGTITPGTPLPAITADRVFLEGASKITLDGSASHYGLDMRARCESVVQGLALRDFGDYGLTVASGNCQNSLDQRRVSGNTIAGNFRGLRLDDARDLVVRDNVISDNLRSGIWSWNGSNVRIFRNRIERNGASGIFLGPAVVDIDITSNTIAGHPDMGVAVAGGAKQVTIRSNAMRDNRGLGIDWELDGVSPVDADDRNTHPNAPVLLSARYDAAANQTHVTMLLKSAPLGTYPLWIIDFFTNDAPDGDGERWLDSRWVTAPPEIPSPLPGPFTVSLTGNHAGKWLNATSTRVHSIYSEPYVGPATTSELSNAVAVEWSGGL